MLVLDVPVLDVPVLDVLVPDVPVADPLVSVVGSLGPVVVALVALDPLDEAPSLALISSTGTSTKHEHIAALTKIVRIRRMFSTA